VRLRFWIECALALLSGALLVLTLIEPEWIEVIFKIEPDEGSGDLERMIVALSLVVTIVFVILASVEWRSFKSRQQSESPRAT
jgi:hypothetical protein